MIYHDDFSKLNPGWTNDAGYLHVEGNKLVLKPPIATNKAVVRLLEAEKFTDIDASIDVRLGSGADGTGNAGLAFWAPDNQDDYILAVNEQGRFALVRHVKGRVTFPIAWQTNEAVKHGADAVNHLRVVTRGSDITVFINDKELMTVPGQPPDGGGFIGVASTTSEKTAHAWEFSNLVVRKPSG